MFPPVLLPPQVFIAGAKAPHADLTDAIITEEQLAQCRSLEGATMPNAQKYEDWLRDKVGRGEDGENPAPS